MINALNVIKQIDRNSTVLLVMGTPCEKLSRGVSFQQNPKAKIGMHAEPSNLLFIAHEIRYNNNNSNKNTILRNREYLQNTTSSYL